MPALSQPQILFRTSHIFSLLSSHLPPVFAFLPFYHGGPGPPQFVAYLLLSGKLVDHLVEIDTQAEAMFSQLVEQLTEQEGITEQLKTENQMEWVGRMNNVRSRAEEVICNELIYV